MYCSLSPFSACSSKSLSNHNPKNYWHVECDTVWSCRVFATFHMPYCRHIYTHTVIDTVKAEGHLLPNDIANCCM